MLLMIRKQLMPQERNFKPNMNIKAPAKNTKMILSVKILDRQICANSVGPDETEGTVWLGYTLFAILDTSPIMVKL